MKKMYTISCLNDTQNLQDAEDIVHIFEIRNLGGHQDTETKIEQLINKLEDELFFLVKNQANNPIGYASATKSQDAASRLYTLFILPQQRNQGAGSATLQYIIKHYGSKNGLYVEVYTQDEYDHVYCEKQNGGYITAVDREKLIKLLENHGFIIENKNSRKTHATYMPMTI